MSPDEELAHLKELLELYKQEVQHLHKVIEHLFNSGFKHYGTRSPYERKEQQG